MGLTADASEAVVSLCAARQRSVLALIGIGWVIAMLSVGTITRRQALERFRVLGTDCLTIQVRTPRSRSAPPLHSGRAGGVVAACGQPFAIAVHHRGRLPPSGLEDPRASRRGWAGPVSRLAPPDQARTHGIGMTVVRCRPPAPHRLHPIPRGHESGADRHFHFPRRASTSIPYRIVFGRFPVETRRNRVVNARNPGSRTAGSTLGRGTSGVRALPGPSSGHRRNEQLRLRDVRKTYADGPAALEVLRGVDLEVNRGDFVSITGASGSGKSTLMNIIGLLDTPTGGSYSLDGREVSAMTDDRRSAIRNASIGFVFQSFHLLPRLTALENVRLPLMYRRAGGGETGRRARGALERVGMADRAGHRPDELSGGQQRRVAIARALVGEPAILLADEPTGALDPATGNEIIELFAELNGDGATVIVVTHDPEVARRCARRTRIGEGVLREEARRMPASRGPAEDAGARYRPNPVGTEGDRK